ALRGLPDGFLRGLSGGVAARRRVGGQVRDLQPVPPDQPSEPFRRRICVIDPARSETILAPSSCIDGVSAAPADRTLLIHHEGRVVNLLVANLVYRLSLAFSGVERIWRVYDESVLVADISIRVDNPRRDDDSGQI